MNMKRIQEVMSKKVQSISPRTPLSEASVLMAHQNVAMLPVGENGKMMGVLTEHDMVSQVLAQGKNPSEIVAQDVMSPKNFYCYASEEVEEAMDRMENKHVSRLFVIDDQDRLLGELRSEQLEEVQEDEDFFEVEEVSSQLESSGEIKISDLILNSIHAQTQGKRHRMKRVVFFFVSIVTLGLMMLGWSRRPASRIS